METPEPPPAVEISNPFKSSTILPALGLFIVMAFISTGQIRFAVTWYVPGALMVAGTARMGVGAAMPWDAKIGCRGAAGAVIALTMTASATVSSICLDFIGTLSYLSATSLIAGIPLHRLPIPYPPLALLLAELFVTVVMMANKILRQSIKKPCRMINVSQDAFWAFASPDCACPPLLWFRTRLVGVCDFPLGFA